MGSLVCCGLHFLKSLLPWSLSTGVKADRIGQISRPLTSGEIELAQEVFGKAIEYDRIKIFRRKYLPFQRYDITMAPNGHLYFAPNAPGYTKDFSKADFLGKHHFLHELTHVFQYQLGQWVRSRGAVLGLFHQVGLKNVYAYELKDQKFSDYNLEQQGEIVADFFTLTHFGKRANSCQNPGKDDLGTYRKILSFLHEG